MILLACLWIAWCALHSLLISRQAHHMAERALGESAGIYRILYILFSIITLLPVLWYQFSLPQHIIVEANMFIRLTQGALLFYGILMFYLGARVYDMQFFLGISQWQNAKKNNKPARLPFHTDGVLAYVRHPWYSGGIAFIWGFGSVTDIYLLSRLILTVYFIIGTVHEERRLVIELGDVYKTYRRQVPMLIPWKSNKP
jgi:methanethiol S-methyltransferase